MKNKLKQLASWAKANPVPALLIGATLIVIVSGIVGWVVLGGGSQISMDITKPIRKALKPEPPKTYFSPLTGKQVPDEAATKKQVTAVMIENSPDARPQSGMKTAGLIYEAIAEGGITRFVCLYQEDRPGLIGPVRSLRPYFLEWAAPYDPAIAHVGGSKRALDTVRGGGYKDLDQFFNAGAFYRSSDRYAPHNVYTTFDRIDKANQDRKYTSSTFESIPRKEDSLSSAPNATSINVTIGGSLYNSAYNYDRGSNSYIRKQAGANHRDREGGQLAPKVVVVIKVPMSSGFEDGYREQINTNGTGDAYIFQDGTAKQAKWLKSSAKAPLVLVDEKGTPIPLNRGQTWITAIPKQQSVTWK